MLRWERLGLSSSVVLSLFKLKVLLDLIFKAIEIVHLLLQDIVNKQIKDLFKVDHVAADNAIAHALYQWQVVASLIFR